MKMMNILMFVLIVIALVIAIAATAVYKKQSKATTKKDEAPSGEGSNPQTEVVPLTKSIVIGLWVGFAALALGSYMTGAIWLILAIVAMVAYGASAYLAAQPNPNFAEEVKEDE